jgi:hypothetical protein
MFSSRSLEEALETLGEVLADQGQHAELAVIGGGSLLLSQLLERPTKDLDVVAMVIAGQYRRAQPFPGFLAAAVQDVADATGLAPDWLNPGPTDLLDFGLPLGFEQRATVRRFGGLTLHVASRKDQICFKLYASVDQGPQSKHTADLKKLRPSPEELRWAGEWCRTQDPSDGFAQQLELTLQAFGGSDGR